MMWIQNWGAFWVGRHELSGEFLDYDDPRIARPALEVFGERLI